MFDIGFLELFVIGIIALIVLGPERLPKAARALGLWVGKAKQSFNSIKNEIDRELQVKELQQKIDQQKAQLAKQVELDSLQQKFENAQQSMRDVSAEFTANVDHTIANDHTDTCINPEDDQTQADSIDSIDSTNSNTSQINKPRHAKK